MVERREAGHTGRGERRVGVGGGAGSECAYDRAGEWAAHAHDGHRALAAAARERVDRVLERSSEVQVRPAGGGVEEEEGVGDGRDNAIIVDVDELEKRRNCRKVRERGI